MNSLKIGMNRFTLFILAALMIGIFFGYLFSSKKEDSRYHTLVQVNAQMRELDQLRDGLNLPESFETGTILSQYLSDARRDGLGQHAVTKATIDAITIRLISIQALLQLYQTQVSTDDLLTDIALFHGFVNSWVDRRDSLFELYMLGGGVPTAMSPYPSRLNESIGVEMDKVR